MQRTGVLWLVPLFMAIHNVEEWVSFAVYLPLVEGRLPGAVLKLVGLPTVEQMRLALVVVTAIPVVLAAWMSFSSRKEPAVSALLLFQAMLLLNVIWHVGSAIAFRSYLPGLITAVCINLPFSIYLFRRAAREQWVSRRRVTKVTATPL